MTAARSEIIVIIGGGLAGARAAETLRTEGFSGRVMLISSDSERPYDHVPLSKNYLRGEPGYHRLYVHEESFYDEHAIDLRVATTVSAIDPAAHQLHLGSGEAVHYDKLLIATGSRNRRLRLPGSDLDGIFYLRTLAEADLLKAALAQAEGVVVVGDGFVGCEIAASARQMGLDVTLIGREPMPMLRALGPVGAGFYRDLHAAHGVHLHSGASASRFRGTGGQVRAVVLSDGTELAADVVVVGIGAQPNVELAADAGLAVDNGIVTDTMLATSAADVYAAGDVASVPNPVLGGRIRVEHFATALVQGPVAARNMLGRNVRHDRVPFFFSDQYDVWMEYTGYGLPDAETLVRGDPTGGEFVIFWLRENRLLAAMNVNVRGIPDIVTPIIAGGRPVDRAALTDPGVDLANLAP